MSTPNADTNNIIKEFVFPHEKIQDKSEHTIQKILREAKRLGMIKKCGHIKIKKSPLESEYKLECTKGSLFFDKKNNGTYSLYGCAKNCLCYEPQWKTKIKSRCKRGFELVKSLFSSDSKLQKTLVILIIFIAIYLFFGLDRTLKIVNAINF